MIPSLKRPPLQQLLLLLSLKLTTTTTTTTTITNTTRTTTPTTTNATNRYTWAPLSVSVTAIGITWSCLVLPFCSVVFLSSARLAGSDQQRPVRRLLLGHIHRVGRAAHHILRPLLARRGRDRRMAVLQQVGRVQFMVLTTNLL